MLNKVMLLRLAGRDWALPVEPVRHILPRPQLYPLVRLPQIVSGVFLYAGEPVPLLDPVTLVADDPTVAAAEWEYVVVLQSDYGPLGLPVETAVRIVDAADGRFEPDVRTDNMEQHPTFIFRETGYPILDIDALLTR